MNTSTTGILGTKRQTICRQTTWRDVLKFFVFNYGLHVLTVVTSPGSRPVPSTIRALGALLLPFSGIFRALDVIERYARGQSGDLQTAHRAGALCMFFPTRLLNDSSQQVSRQVTDVHGQHPLLPQSTLRDSTRTSMVEYFRKWRLRVDSQVAFAKTTIEENLRTPRPGMEAMPSHVLDLMLQLHVLWVIYRTIIMAIFRGPPVESDATDAHDHNPDLPVFHQNLDQGNEQNTLPEFSLIVVPKSFTVAPLSDSGFTPLTLSYNYSIPKAIVAIIQVVYGTMELYESSVRQLPKFGYAAYSLTVIPYLIMSLLNLVAAACEPQYPTMFLVGYGGDSNAVPIQRGVSSDAIEQDGGVPAQAGAVGDRPEELIQGAVGEAYGGLHGDLAGNKPFKGSAGETVRRWIIVFFCGWFLIAVPHIMIHLLTHHHGRESTVMQRSFTMVWLVLGQVYGSILYSDQGNSGVLTEIWALSFVLISGAGAVGGFVVVGQMMMMDEVCIVI